MPIVNMQQQRMFNVYIEGMPCGDSILVL